MSAELDKQLADLIERCKRTDAAIAQMRADIEQGDRIDSVGHLRGSAHHHLSRIDRR